MTPRLVACYDGEFYTKLALVLAESAREHAPNWRHDIVRVSLSGAAPKLSYWLSVVEAAPEGECIALLDADTMITGPIDGIWDQPFDLCFTARDRERSKWPYNCGVVFVRASAGVRDFLRAWMQETARRVSKHKDSPERKRDRELHGASEQAAFHHVLTSEHGARLVTAGVPCRIWNCEDSEWGRFGADTKIVHVKGAFRDVLKGRPARPGRKKSIMPLVERWKVVSRRAKGIADVAPVDLYSEAWQAGRHRHSVQAMRCLESVLGVLQPSSLLDLGSGTGQLVRRAQTMGVNAVGLDISETATDGPLRHADLTQPVDLGQTFGAVLCWEVAEHLPAEAADTLCETLARHVAEDGVLVFTAATPGQGGKGHVNEQPLDYWRAKLAALGLTYDRGISSRLAKDFTRVAAKTPWYGANVQVFRRRPVMVLPEPGEVGSIVLTIRTADRAPRTNYVGATLRRLHTQGIDLSTVQLCFTAPQTGWFESELGDLPRPACHVPSERLKANMNGLAQVEAGLATGAEWIVLLEDDLEFCADFLPSLTAWLTDHARDDRHVYRLFGFVPNHSGSAAHDHPLEKLRGSQAIVLRREDAADFLTWGRQHQKDWIDNLKWRSSGANPYIAFDKFVAAWALHRWPGVPGVLSSPHFVNHVGNQSSIHARGVRNDAPFAGTRWRYEGAA